MIEAEHDYIPCPVYVRAREQPEAVALEARDFCLTYEELDARIASVGVRLVERGLTPGSRIAIVAENSTAYVMVLLAMLRRGYVACPMNVRRPAGQIRFMTSEIDCAGAIAGLDHASDVEAPWLLDDLTRPSEDRAIAHSPQLRLGRSATIVFTSGSTGRPRAALHTYGNHWFNALGANENMPLGPGDRWLLSLPLYHVGGLGIVFRCIAAGAAVCVPDPAESLAMSVARLGITHLSLVPTQLRRLLDDPIGMRVDQLRGVLLGGAPVPQDLVGRALDRGVPLHTSYGLTEMASQVATTHPGAPRDVLRTAGRTLTFRQLSITADGEIRLRGETLYSGYVTKDGVDLPLDAEGWFRTGDLGRLDEHGRLHVSGRRDNLFISGGENIQPEEIELALLGLPEIEEVVVVPVPDPEFGARPVAVIRAATDPPDDAVVRAYLRPLVPGYMIPIAFLHAPEDLWPRRLKPDRARLAEFATRSIAREREDDRKTDELAR